LHFTHVVRARWRLATGTLLLVLAAAVVSTGRGSAASSTGCEGGAFSVLGLSGDRTATVPAAAVPATFLVK